MDPTSIKSSVLFVGNSFTFYNDMPVIAQNLGNSLGMKLSIDSVTKGSQKLIDTASSTDELGAEFDEKLKTPFDYFILQEQSTTPVNNYDTFNSGVQAMKNKILAAQPNAKIYLYATWAYTAMTNQGETIPEAESRIREAYHRCGQANNLPVVDVGKAFTHAYNNNKDIYLYGSDDKHPSYEGSYLSAATHVASIFNVDIREASFLGSVNAKVSSTLCDIAYNVAKGIIK